MTHKGVVSLNPNKINQLFVYFIKAYVVGTHLNYIDLSMQFK